MNPWSAVASSPTRPHWERIGMQRRSGVAVPLASLRSERGLGVGDVADLHGLVDWCAAIGASVVQLLPLNDMGRDTCPYASLSAFAMDPVYIAVDRVAELTGHADLVARLSEARERLNAAPRVDYEAVRHAKLSALFEAYQRMDRAQVDERLWLFGEQNPWLDDYALYRVLKEHHGWASWEGWAAEVDTPDKLEAFRKAHHDGIRFHKLLQQILDQQLREARAYADERGVLLKGDIPILIGLDSVDVWRQPHLFHLDKAAGAPPDMYAEDGQKWGSPTYDWAAHERDGFAWWRARLAQCERYFDLYRVDHIVGFFRIWSVARDAENGREGGFDPRDEARWGAHGRHLLEMMIEASRMLPIGEDLGTIPHVCRDTMRALGICGMKVDRWERRWEEDGGHIAPEDFPPLSVATLSTHDSETLAGWWQAPAYAEDRQRLYEALGHQGPAPDPLPNELQIELLRRISRAGSLFVIHLIHDLLSPLGLLPGEPAEHRVNVPGTVGPHNWTWRMPVTLEALRADHASSGRVKAWLAR